MQVSLEACIAKQLGDVKENFTVFFAVYTMRLCGTVLICSKDIFLQSVIALDIFRLFILVKLSSFFISLDSVLTFNSVFIQYMVHIQDFVNPII